MTQQALIRGEVEFRAGDGMMVPIPDGPVEIDMADDDSVTLSWVEGADASATAITRAVTRLRPPASRSVRAVPPA